MSNEQYWQVTAFLLRENGLWNGNDDINETNAANILVHSQLEQTPPMPPQTEEASQNKGWYWSLALIFIFAVGFWIFKLHGKAQE